MKKKFAAAALMLSMCACLVACGDKKDDKTSDSGNNTSAATEAATEAGTEAATEEAATEAAAGVNIASTETWGDYTVGIPEGWEFKKGDVFDENDTKYCSVKKSSFSYFDFKMETEDTQKQQYEYNKKTYTNEQTDVSATYGEIAWTGFQYSDGYGGYGFEAYATANGKPVRVSCAGFKFDSAEAQAVLGSLVIK